MRLLVLGGTVFLSQAVAANAVRRGHDVTCACRGTSGSVPTGAQHLVIDRGADDASALAGGWDAVVDVARIPSWVRRAVAAVPDAHWVFVSTINVYPDTATPGGTPETLALHTPLHEPLTTDEDPTRAEVAYGAMKVACEQLVQGGADSATVIRPGLIVGPGDPTGRFAYWPWRLAAAADGDAVLAPGAPSEATQVVDVRDLAAWIVDCAERRAVGVYDGVGPAVPRGELLARVADGVGARPAYTWVEQGFLLEHGIEPWAGERALPLWLPLPQYAGLLAHNHRPAAGAGLRTRPLEETARDTLAWLEAEPAAARTGLGRAEERELLAAWRAVHPPRDPQAPVLLLMVGLPGSGKTTRAKELAATHRALRLSPDDWMIPLYGDSMADGKRYVLEGRLISVALQALRVGTSVVLDYGLWGRDERSALRWLAGASGATCRVVYLPVDVDVQLARIARRQETEPHLTFPMSEAEVAQWRTQFHVPDTAELDGGEIPGPPAGWPGWSEWAEDHWPSCTDS